MTNISFGYDLSSTTYSPDGKIFQIEYISKVFSKSPTVIGMVCNDGVLIIRRNLNENPEQFDNLVGVFPINRTNSIGATGFFGDVKFVIERIKCDSKNYQKIFSDFLCGSQIIFKICLLLHMYTFYWHLRPLVCSVILGTVQQNKLELYTIFFTGYFTKCFACAIGKNSENIQTSLEKLVVKSLSCRKSIQYLIKTFETSKPIETEDLLEINWFSKENSSFTKPLSCNLINEVERLYRISKKSFNYKKTIAYTKLHR